MNDNQPIEAILYFSEHLKDFSGADDPVMRFVEKAQKEWKRSRTKDSFDQWIEHHYGQSAAFNYCQYNALEEDWGNFLDSVWKVVGDGAPYDYPAQVLRAVEGLHERYLGLLAKEADETRSGA